MAILQLGNGDGFFTINGGLFPKGQFYIDKSGPRLSVIATDNLWLRVTGRFDEWRGAEGETFANRDEASDYISGLMVDSGGGGGEIPDGSIGEEKLSEGVQTKLNIKEADYIIEKVGATVYAHPTGSLTAYSGSSFNTVISNAMSQLTTGGNILIKRGLYDNLSTIEFPFDDIKLKGEGKRLTVLKIKDEADLGFESEVNLFTSLIAINKNRCEVHDIELDGNGINQLYINDGTQLDGPGSVSGIIIGGDYQEYEDVKIENCYIHDFTQFGIWAEQNTNRVKIINCDAIDNYWNGLCLGGFNGLALNCFTQGSGDVGIVMSSSNNDTIGCTVGPQNGMFSSVSSRWGIAIELAYPPERTPTGNRIINCRIESDDPMNMARAISVYKGAETTISDVRIKNTSEGIFLETSNNCTISNVEILKAIGFGVLLRESSNNLVQNCRVETDLTSDSWCAVGIDSNNVELPSNDNIIKNNYIKGKTSVYIKNGQYNNLISGNIFDSVSNDIQDLGTDTFRVSNFSKLIGGLLNDSSGEDPEPELLQGLTAYYKMDETSGDALDSVGDNDGSVTATQNVAGKINTAYSFNGVADFVNCGTVSSSPNFSFSAWVQNEGSGTQVICSNGKNGGVNIRFVSWGVMELTKSGATTIGASTNIPTGEFFHVAVTYNGTTGDYAFYINGEISGSGAMIETFDFGDLKLGCATDWQGNDIDFFEGKIDEVGYWDRVITQAEVTELYNSGNGLSHPF